jgi:hypothetical protein
MSTVFRDFNIWKIRNAKYLGARFGRFNTALDPYEPKVKAHFPGPKHLEVIE